MPRKMPAQNARAYPSQTGFSCAQAPVSKVKQQRAQRRHQSKRQIHKMP